ncbi:MAG: DUF2608 domain-containing protein [Alphaproteobacteria bacterium]|jgi:hypothetical protein|nr:DUF2608 domain-containing protein [Alphaproteobacteria bacterium]
MKHFKSIMTLALTLGIGKVQAEIISLKRMREVQAKILNVLENNKASDVLAAFDIDMTLTQPIHPATYYPALKKYRDVYKEILEGLSSEQKDMVSTLMVQTTSHQLVEKETPKIIKELQGKGVRTIAFTATLTGKLLGFPKKGIFIRRDQLQKIGLDFTDSFKGYCRCAPYMDFPRYATSHPMFFHGVLSSNGEGKISKGETLIAFLTHLGQKYQQKMSKPGYYPKVIVMVDDRMKNLVDVEKSLKAHDPTIHFIGIEYQGAYSYAPQDITEEDFTKYWKDLAVKAKTVLE